MSDVPKHNTFYSPILASFLQGVPEGPLPLPGTCPGTEIVKYCLGERFTLSEPRVQNAKSTASALH